MNMLRIHGDSMVVDGQLDFAVSAWPARRPAALESVLQDALRRPGYPDEAPARAAVAAKHGRRPEEVLLTNGACEAFWLLAQALRPRRAACVHPGFTEPEAALRSVGCRVTRVMREPVEWSLDTAAVPPNVDMVVLGNPDNPTGRLERTTELATTGRLLVVDESFIDFVPGERESLAHRADVVVVRSLTKIWSLAGIRAGYLLAPPELVERLRAHRQPWSVNALACAALAYCAADSATPQRVQSELVTARREFTDLLSGVACVERVWPSAANFLLLRVTDGPRVVAALAARGIAVRSGASFPGLDANAVRVAVRQPRDNRRLAAALLELG